MIDRLFAWLGRLTGTIVLMPHLWKLGDRTDEIFYGLLKARREHKRLVIVLPYELPWRFRFPLTNGEVADVECEFRAVSRKNPLCIAAGVILTVYYAALRVLGYMLRRLFNRPVKRFDVSPSIGTLTLWQPRPRMPRFSWDVADRYEWRKQVEVPVTVTIASRKRSAAQRMRSRMGLPDDAWYVCLHVREGGYWRDQSARNANISSYTGVIEEVTARGGWVVRMGDPMMTRLPPMERMIDYPFTREKSDLMDVYLISECRLYIGMGTGLLDVAELFRRPIVLTNVPGWISTFPRKKGDLGLLKHIYSKSRGRFLSIREWVAEPLAAHLVWRLGSDYVFHDNDSQELRRVVKEFFAGSGDWHPTDLQRRFNELRVRTGRQLLSADQPVVPSDRAADTLERYRLAARLDSSLGCLGADFLEKNWERDARNDGLFTDDPDVGNGIRQTAGASSLERIAT